VVNMTPYTKLASAMADLAMSIPGLSEPVLQFFRNIDFTGTPLSGLTDLTKAVGGGEMRNFAVDRQLVRGGYTQVVVDVRGTGFSQGTWQVFQRREQQDTVETIDWAAHQPWSNGRIGMNGLSYSGINQMQAAEKNPAALKAIFPVVPGSDIAQDIIAPGGGVGFNFLPLWLAAVNGTKFIPDLASALRGQFDMKWLADRAADPFTFIDIFLNAFASLKISDLSPHTQELLSRSSPMRTDLMGNPAKVRVPTFVVGGWHDLFTNSESKIYTAMPLPPGRKQLLMGNTYHVSSGSESGKPGLPPRLDVLQRAWFDKWLKGIDNGIDRYGPVTLRQQGGGWITSGAFTEQGTQYRRMYMSAARSGTSAINAHDGSLVPAPTPDRTSLTVAPGLASICSNDAAQGTAGVLHIINACGSDSRIQETAGLTFTSAPVNAPTSISGPINVHLTTVQDAPDGFWTVTVNDVAPDGNSSVVGSGQLMASLRRINDARSTRSANGDYIDAQPYLSLDQRQPAVPGQATTLDISVPGTSAVLQPGHRLRVDVYAGTFPKSLPPMPLLVDSGLRPQHLVLDPARPSYVNIGLKGNPGW
ncbi:MAG: CocE/NonD family hydrolase, partial [Mycobacteriaceae bacterium]|nr:CocE/NonD family hydrolase [Mycobacteriaceae bacterium]